MNPSFFPPTITSSKLTLSTIISGASKTLNFINQAIPVYYQTKPLINNTKTLIKGIVKTRGFKEEIKEEKQQHFKEIKELKTAKKESSQTLTFFQ